MKEKKGVKLDHISKIYQDPKTGSEFYAVKDTTLEIKPGSFVTLLGPSGCGKTTTLRMIAGFESPDEGEIYLGDEAINALPPNKRDTAMVFQSYALLPHYNVFDNVAYGLKIRKVPKAEIEERVLSMLKLVEMEGMETRMTNQLSGGQQQRVALARTLNQNPRIILADEPVASLDPIMARQVMRDFVRINKEYNITILLNIHHVDLALEYCDRVLGVREGQIVFDGPANTITKEQIDEVYNGTKVPTLGEE